MKLDQSRRYSNEKAARIANSSDAERKEGISIAFYAWTKDALYEQGKCRRIKGRSKWIKLPAFML